MRIFSLLLFVALLAGCGSEQTPDLGLKRVADMEAQFAEEDSPAAAQKLLDTYENYVETHPDDAENNSIFLERAADVHYRGARFSSTVDVLSQAIRLYPQAENAFRMANKMAKVYADHLEQPEVAQSIWQAMGKAYARHSGIDSIQAKVANLPAITVRMDTLLNHTVDVATGRLSLHGANAYIANAEAYATIAQADPVSPGFLFKAAEVAGYVGMYDRSLALYKRIETNFPAYDKASKALFMQAFIYAENLGQPEQAKTLYEKFIAKYPNDDFADDAQALLDNLGKSDEEILQGLEAQQQEQ
ncbi:MAG: tetratricopeptide repeat protein [Lewinella sp.]|nr:tetratricopeptide repeat protein [Lewinella sp.]